MNTRFPLLSVVSKIMRFVGGLLVLAGLYYFIYEGLIEPRLPGHHFDPDDLVELLCGIAGVVVGFGTVAAGELIGVLFAIEENTRGQSGA